jgi:hypothetical protein
VTVVTAPAATPAATPITSRAPGITTERRSTRRQRLRARKQCRKHCRKHARQRARRADTGGGEPEGSTPALRRDGDTATVRMSRPRPETQARAGSPARAQRRRYGRYTSLCSGCCAVEPGLRLRRVASPPMMTTTPAASTAFPAVSSTSSTRPVPCVIPVQGRPERYGAARAEPDGFALEGRMVM